MPAPSDSELREIVRRVVCQALGMDRATGRDQTPGEARTPDAPRSSMAGRGNPAAAPADAPTSLSNLQAQAVALGADHGGYALKEKLKETVASLGHSVIDCGTDSEASVDYPDFAYAVARLVSEGRAWRGIIVDGAGIGSCMAANKVPGVRAALCYDHATAVNSREHNDANVLTLGAGLVGPALADQVARTWLATEFAGGRHARRVDKIVAVERRFLKAEG